MSAIALIATAAASRFSTLANGFCSNKRWWLWVPAFAGTTQEDSIFKQPVSAAPSALVLLVCGTISVHRIPPRVRDDREPPLCGTGRQGCIADLGEMNTEIFLREGLDS